MNTGEENKRSDLGLLFSFILFRIHDHEALHVLLVFGMTSLAALGAVAEEVSADASSSKLESALPTLALHLDVSLLGVTHTACRLASKCHRSKRLCTRDVERALKLEYGPVPLHFVAEEAKAIEGKDVLVFQDSDVDLKALLESPLPKVPVAPWFSVHWMAVDGSQTDMPENHFVSQDEQSILDLFQIGKEATKHKHKNKNEISSDSRSKLDNSVVLTRELQLYLEKVIGNLLQGERDAGSQEKVRATLASVCNDEGINRTVPHLVRFITKRVETSMNNLASLWTCVNLAECLVTNESLAQLDLYLHDLLPSMLTCVVAKSLGQSPAEDHWALREAAASVIASMCRRFGSQYANLQPRVASIYREAINMEKPLTTIYGGIVGITSLGPLVVNSLLVPFLRGTEFLHHVEKTSHVGPSTAEYNAVEEDTHFVCRLEALRVLLAVRKALSYSCRSLGDYKDKWDIVQQVGCQDISHSEELHIL